MPTDEKTTSELPEDLTKALGDLGIELNDKQTAGFNEAVGAALVAAVAEKPELTDDEITAKGWVRVEVSDGDEDKDDEPVTKTEIAKSENEVELEKAVVAGNARIQKLEDDAAITLRAESVAKAYPHLAVDAKDFAGALHRIDKHEATEADLELLQTTLAGAEAAAATNDVLSAEIGSAVPGGSGNVGDEIEKIAAGFMAGDPTMTKSAAIAKAAVSPEGRAAYAATSPVAAQGVVPPTS